MVLQQLKLITISESCNLTDVLPIPQNARMVLLPQSLVFTTGIAIHVDKPTIPTSISVLNSASVVRLGLFGGGRNRQQILGTLDHLTGKFIKSTEIHRFDAYVCIYS